MSTPYQVPFGEGTLRFAVPAGWPVDMAEAARDVPALHPAEIANRLRQFGDDLRQRLDPARPVLFVFTDATRASPDQTLLEPLARMLHEAGFNLRFMCAVGMHRPSTAQEKRAKLGDWIVDTFPVMDHDPAAAVVYGTVDRVPVEAHPALKEASVVSVGVVEPHQYAGYSGGAKTVVIGCGGPQTIAATHGPAFLDQPGTRLGRVVGNPFQEFVRQAGRLIGEQWVVNVLLGPAGGILDLATGRPDAVHDHLVTRARVLYEIPVPRVPYDVVVAGVGAPKDANLYQASRAATYIGLSGQPVIRRGGVIIVPAPLPEGGGQGQGERNFMTALLRFGPSGELIDRLRAVGCQPGEQRAFMVAQLRQRYRLLMVGASNPQPVLEAGLDNAPDMEAALKAAARLTRLRAPRVLVVPHALQTIPVPPG